MQNLTGRYTHIQMKYTKNMYIKLLQKEWQINKYTGGWVTLSNW